MCEENNNNTIANMSLRVAAAHWINPESFNKLIAILKKNPGLADELSLFSSAMHCVQNVEEILNQIKTLKFRFNTARAAGFRVGVNLLCTIGHVDEYVDQALQGDYTPLTDRGGVEARCSFCPNDSNFRKHTKEVYTALAEAHPDFIWLDDDIRLHHHVPAPWPCFCGNCLAIFNSRNGTSYTRESLNAAFDQGSREERLFIRRKWLEHNSSTIQNLLDLIKTTVYGIDPEIRLGFMSIEQFYEGYNFDKYCDILQSGSIMPIKWRPGGGFFSDKSLGDAIAKAHCIGRQVSILNKGIKDIQAEIENFPYQLLKKSPHSVIMEASAYIAAGSTGTAFNILGMFDEPLDEYEPMIKRLSDSRPFFDLLVNKLDGYRPKGIWAAWKKDLMASNHLYEGRWLDGAEFQMDFQEDLKNRQLELAEIGLPVAYSQEDSTVSLLSRFALEVFENAEIESLFAQGVYLDSSAIELLEARGLTKLAGFKTEKLYYKDFTEVISNDVLNANKGGYRRDCAPTFFGGDSTKLIPVTDTVRILSNKSDRLGTELGCILMGAYENKSGGRIVSASYSPWKFLQSESKTRQLKSLFRWLSRDGLPGYIESYHKINLWIREVKGGQLAAVLLNASYEPAVNVSLLLKINCEKISSINMECHYETIERNGTDGPYSRFELPVIKPWHMILVLTYSNKDFI